MSGSDSSELSAGDCKDPCRAQPVDLRPATPEDVPAIDVLVKAAYRRGKGKSSWTNEDRLVAGKRISVEELEAIVADPSKAIIVLEGEDRGLIGCVLVEDHRSGECHIGLLSVDPDLQSAGVGTRLLRGAEEFAVKQFGSRRAIMWILEGRDELLAWYERTGYRTTGQTEPFPGPESGAVPLVDGLRFLVIDKTLVQE